MVSGLRSNSANQAADERARRHAERDIKQQRITMTETKRNEQSNRKRQPSRKISARGSSEITKRHKLQVRTTDNIENNKENYELSIDNSRLPVEVRNRQREEDANQSKANKNTEIIENLNRVTEEERMKDDRLATKNRAGSRAKDDVSGLTSTTTTTGMFCEDDYRSLTPEIKKRWDLQKKSLMGSLQSIVEEPKWFGRFKFANKKICYNLIMDSLRLDKIACTKGLSPTEFASIASKKMLYTAFNAKRHNAESKMRSAYMSK